MFVSLVNIKFRNISAVQFKPSCTGAIQAFLFSWKRTVFFRCCAHAIQALIDAQSQSWNHHFFTVYLPVKLPIFTLNTFPSRHDVISFSEPHSFVCNSPHPRQSVGDKFGTLVTWQYVKHLVPVKIRVLSAEVAKTYHLIQKTLIVVLYQSICEVINDMRTKRCRMLVVKDYIWYGLQWISRNRSFEYFYKS